MVGAIQALPKGVYDADVRLTWPPNMDALIMKMRAFVLGEEGDKIEISYPEDWWQAVRERWLPKWWIKKYPVKYKEHYITPQTIYPHFRISIPEKRVLKLIHRTGGGYKFEE